MTTPTIYQDHGHDDREAYLLAISEETGVELETVKNLAELLGPSEDFDGLVTSLEDAEALIRIDEESSEDEDDNEEIDSDFDENDDLDLTDSGERSMWEEW